MFLIDFIIVNFESISPEFHCTHHQAVWNILLGGAQRRFIRPLGHGAFADGRILLSRLTAFLQHLTHIGVSGMEIRNEHDKFSFYGCNLPMSPFRDPNRELF